MFEDIREDMKCYARYGGWARNPGFWVTLTHRFGHWSRSVKPAPVRLGLRIAARLAATPWRLVKDVQIDARVEIGPGLLIVHPHSIYLPRGSKLGANCCLFHEVTLGHGPVAGVPQLGDNVVLFAGAKVLGGVSIGDQAEIGANAVVAKDVPAKAVVAGPLGRAIPNSMAAKLSQRGVKS